MDKNQKGGLSSNHGHLIYSTTWHIHLTNAQQTLVNFIVYSMGSALDVGRSIVFRDIKQTYLSKHSSCRCDKFCTLPGRV